MLPIEKLEAVDAPIQRGRRPALLARRAREPPSAAAAEQGAQRDRAGRRGVRRVARSRRKIKEDEEALADPELRELVEGAARAAEAALVELEENLQLLLLPTDPNDKKNIILEIRGGEGGEEAALFAADLFRMYAATPRRRRWKVEVLIVSESTTGGYKEGIALVSGKDVYSQLRFEGGVHRVQRVPATETQGRIHTSTATVAVLPEAEEVDVQIDDKDLEDLDRRERRARAGRASTRPTAPCRSCTSRRASSSSARTSARS